MKKPPFGDAERCIDLRKQSKQGRLLDEGNTAFVRKMRATYPEWYTDTERRVFLETAPFGARVDNRTNKTSKTGGQG